MNLKSKVSRSRRGQRRSHDRAAVFQSKKCSNCQTEVLSHQICFQCGYYKKRQVLIPKAVKEVETPQEA